MIKFVQKNYQQILNLPKMVAIFYDIFIKNKLFDKISVFFDFFLSAHSYQLSEITELLMKVYELKMLPYQNNCFSSVACLLQYLKHTLSHNGDNTQSSISHLRKMIKSSALFAQPNFPDSIVLSPFYE